MKNDPIPELKDNGSYSNKRIVSVLNTLIHRENERNSNVTVEVVECARCGSFLTANGVALETSVHDCYVPQPKQNEGTHTDRRGRHDKMICWGLKSCQGCECMCHQPEDSTKAEHDREICRKFYDDFPNTTQAEDCGCKCHKKPECKHEWISETGNCALCAKFPSKQDTVQEVHHRVLAWLGCARDHMRAKDVASLQNILDEFSD